MVDITRTEPGSSGTFGRSEFDRLIEEIREVRESQDLRFSARAQAPLDTPPEDVPSEESLPLFLTSTDAEDAQQDTGASDDWPSYTWENDPSPHDAWLRDLLQKDAPQRDIPLEPNRLEEPQDVPLQTIRERAASPQVAREQHDRPRPNPRLQHPLYEDVRQKSVRPTAPQQASFQEASSYQEASWIDDTAAPVREHPDKDNKPSIAWRVLRMGLVTASIAGALLALLTLEDQRNVISGASAAIAAVLPGFSASVGQPAPAQPQIAAINPAPVPVATVAVAPTREAIAVAYQTALQSQPEIRQAPVVSPPPAPEASPPSRRMDPDEVAALLKRAQGLLDIGDFTSARLLLARAADAHEAKAAFILAQTYDPAVLGTTDSRSITPDPATARVWYQKAAQFGSSEAQQRLAQMQ